MRHEMIPSGFGTNREVAGATPFHMLEMRINRLFDDIWRDLDGGVAGTAAVLSPRVDLGEDDSNIHVSAEIPRLTEDKLEVNFADGTLTIAGEKSAETTDKAEGRRYVLSERAHGRFERHLPLSRDIDQDKVEARFDNGVLTVTLPKTEQGGRSRPIEVKRAA